MPGQVHVRSLSPVFSFVLLFVCVLFPIAALAAPSITLSKRVGPPTSKILVSGRGFQPNIGVDIYFDTKDEALVVTNKEGEFHNATIHAPRSAHPGEHWVTALERNDDKGDQEPFVVFTDWPQFRFDGSHTGFNRYENLLDANSVVDLTLKWSYTVGDYPSSPAIAEGVAYISAGGVDYALNAESGHLFWLQSTVTEGLGLAVTSDTVYVPSNGVYLYALDAQTGSAQWTYPVGTDQGSPTVVNGVVYVGSVNAGQDLFALNANTGEVLWSRALGGHYSSPAVARGKLYIGSDDGTMSAFSASTGTPLWTYRTGNQVESSPAVDNGIVYFGSEDDNVYALEANTGALLWKFGTSGAVDSSPAVANGVVYVGSGDNNVYALNAITGDLLWKYATSGYVFSSPAVANGVVYVGSDFNIYALDASTGHTVGSEPAES